MQVAAPLAFLFPCVGEAALNIVLSNGVAAKSSIELVHMLMYVAISLSR